MAAVRKQGVRSHCAQAGEGAYTGDKGDKGTGKASSVAAIHQTTPDRLLMLRPAEAASIIARTRMSWPAP